MPKLKPTPPPVPSPLAPRGQRIRLTAASERAGLSLKTLRRRIEDGTLRAYRVAGTRAVRMDHDDLDALFVPINGGKSA
jgi:excisionase family DNA binding protein